MAAKSKKKASFAEGGKIILSYLKEFRGIIVLISALAIIQAVADGTAPYLIGRLFDAILERGVNYDIFGYEVVSWVFFFALLIVVWLVGGLLGWVVDLRNRELGVDLSARYPARAFARLLRLPIAFHKAERTGEVHERVQRANRSLDRIVTEIAIGIGPEILSVIIGLSIAFLIKPILASILVAGVVVYLIALLHLVSPISDLLRKSNKAWRESWGTVSDAFVNYQTVKQATAEDYEQKRMYEKFTEEAAPLGRRIERIWSSITFYQRIIIIITQIALIGTSIYLIRAGELSIGELIALNGYAGMLFGPFVRLGYQWQIVQRGLVDITAAEEMYRLAPERAYEAGEAISDVAGAIEFDAVHFAYPDSKDTGVLKGVSFSVQPGEVVALVGESGVGKSTTIELLSGYYYPTEGAVRIDGNDITTLDLASLRAHIAVVPQEPVLFNDTVRMNIKYGSFDATEEDVKRAAHEAHADEFIEAFPQRYQTLVGERGVKLSVGQKQRIAIARAILRDPKILILDEPTSALDAKTEQFITGSLEKLMAERTTFIIAHRLSTVRKADKILVFEKGKIVEQGTHEELIKVKDGVYRRLYEYQIGLHA